MSVTFTKQIVIAMWLIAMSLLSGCSSKAPEERTSELSAEQAENLVRRSYQYVAMFNVIQKFALDPGSGGMFMDGFNKPKVLTVLADHTMTSIARPNNDTLYQAAALYLRLDPVIIKFPVIDSKFVNLEISGYDHYPAVPLATSNGDFKKPTKIPQPEIIR